jgi:hypothetical protein
MATLHLKPFNHGLKILHQELVFRDPTNGLQSSSLPNLPSSISLQILPENLSKLILPRSLHSIPMNQMTPFFTKLTKKLLHLLQSIQLARLCNTLCPCSQTTPICLIPWSFSNSRKTKCSFNPRLQYVYSFYTITNAY